MNDSEPKNIPFDDDWTPREDQDKRPTIAQDVLHGHPFHRGLAIDLGESEEKVPQTRRVGVVAGIDEVGDDFFIAAKDAPTTPSDYPDAPLAQAGNLFDRANEGPRSLNTVRKAGASTVFFDIDAAIEEGGGKPDHRIEQPDHSFAYTPGS